MHPTTSGITADFCDALTALADRPLPPAARHAAQRTLLNALAAAIGASRSSAVDIATGYARAHGGSPVAPVPGRAERADLLGAALAIGIAVHHDDFDDTHLATLIHPGGATLATVLPLGVVNEAPGESVLRAYALGVEAQLRLGNAISPGHYDAGWHITGTCGVVGAAVAAAVLLGLDAAQMRAATELAATTPLGQREALGSMTKLFHLGQAAANGLLAALIAQRGFSGPESIFERIGGFFDAFTPAANPDELLAGLGDQWELEKNTFKPYPCGIVSHPLIDAAITLSPRIPGTDRVTEIVAHCHPLVVELMGRLQPDDGMQARFSAAHTIAAALVDGALTREQFRDERVTRADVRRLRAVTRFVPSTGIARDEALIQVRLDDGTTVSDHVAHARGSLARPLSDDELTAKARDLIEPVLPGRTDRVVAASRLDGPGSLTALVAAITPDAITPDAITPDAITPDAITPQEG